MWKYLGLSVGCKEHTGFRRFPLLCLFLLFPYWANSTDYQCYVTPFHRHPYRSQHSSISWSCFWLNPSSFLLRFSYEYLSSKVCLFPRSVSLLSPVVNLKHQATVPATFWMPWSDQWSIWFPCTWWQARRCNQLRRSFRRICEVGLTFWHFIIWAFWTSQREGCMFTFRFIMSARLFFTGLWFWLPYAWWFS